ncbi:hypothetical protein BpHYR1_004650 [Brachionus plicatilis]|uniref:Uncharacterized protein n=1 Tax=Brachionus plicatilis TaxID=10195 RepID=A0A3M7S7V0_BRAPC|nr:hypothetical protein BpHYR1_004650 [Brachionus plicatilis]
MFAVVDMFIAVGKSICCMKTPRNVIKLMIKNWGTFCFICAELKLLQVKNKIKTIKIDILGEVLIKLVMKKVRCFKIVLIKLMGFTNDSIF